MGSLKFLSGVINIASYPVLCIDYLQLLFPVLSSGPPYYLSILISTSVLAFLNYTGLAIVGYTAVSLGIISLSPFLILTLLCIPKINPARWLSYGQKAVSKNWTLYFNTLFWNLNFWDNASTLAGEVEDPQTTFPKALFSAWILTCLAYLIPLLAATGTIPLDQTKWVDGYYATIAQIIAGNWLKMWVEIGAVLSAIGLFEAQLSSCAYQVLGMANLGLLPRIFSSRSTWFGTPWLAMLLEFASFLQLRKKQPALHRPYRIPLELPGLITLCLTPSAFLVLIIVISTRTVLLVGISMTVAATLWFFLIKFCKSRKLVEFSGSSSEELLGLVDT